MTLNKAALDRWITSEPQDYSPILVTERNYIEVYGDDLMINELECSWSKKRIGFSDHWNDDDYSLYFTAFYRLDQDGEILVDKEIYEEEEARIIAHENELDRQYAEYLKEVN
jgi:hypothetical protein